MSLRMSRWASRSVIALALALLPALGSAATAELTPELQKVKISLEKYRDPFVAVRDGYFSTVACVELPNGNMGIHFLNPMLIGPVPDPMKPPVLLYEQDGAHLKLVGAEWFVPLATGVKSRPVLFGQPMDGPMEGHFPVMPKELVHYDKHVWLFKDNPHGMFSMSNPNVSCRDAPYPVKLEEHMVPEKGAMQHR